MNDYETALEWFQTNVIELENSKVLSVVYTQEGAVLMICTEENQFKFWTTILWTNFLNETGYQRLPKHDKYTPSRETLGWSESVTPDNFEPIWKFWSN